MKLSKVNSITFNKSNSQGLGSGMRVAFDGNESRLQVLKNDTVQVNSRKEDAVTIKLAAGAIATYQKLTGALIMQNEVLKAENKKLQSMLGCNRELTPKVCNESCGNKIATFA